MAAVLRLLHLDRRAQNMELCANEVQMALGPDGVRYLAGAVFCRDRLCPLCAAFRSRKLFAQVSQVMDALPPKRRFVFLTLTTRNVVGDKLKSQLDAIAEGFKRLMKRKELKIVKGWFRALEVTYSRATGYHPHHHVILSVPESYFTDGYISHATWREMWREACGLDYDPVVDVRTVKPGKGSDISGAVADVAKYTVKTADFLTVDDYQASMDPVGVLAAALAGRRLIGFGGEMRAAHKRLHLDDPIDGDLTERDKLRPDVAYVLERYQWAYGLSGDWYRDRGVTGGQGRGGGRPERPAPLHGREGRPRPQGPETHGAGR